MSSPLNKKIKLDIYDEEYVDEPDAPEEHDEPINDEPVIDEFYNKIKLQDRTFTEQFDVNRLVYLISHPELITDKSAEQMKKILPAMNNYMKASADGKQTVKYAFGVNSSQTKGRLYGKNSMQGLPHRIRHTIAGNYYDDIDIVNCHPCILQQMAVKGNFMCPILTEYNETRDEKFNTFADLYNVHTKKIKKLFNILMNGGSFVKWANDCAVKVKTIPDFIKNYIKEIETLRNNFWAANPKMHAQCTKYATKNNKDPKVTLMSRLLCYKENDILGEIVHFMEQRNRITDVLMFDGCQTRKGEPITDEELLECEEWITDKTTYKIKLTVKPMDEIYAVPLINVVDVVNPAMGIVHHAMFNNELDAAICILKLHTHIKYCNDTLFAFNNVNGLWECSEHKIRANFLNRYLIEMGDWLSVNTNWKNLYNMLKVKCIDDDFIKRMELTSIGKVLFKNGFYTFETKEFSTQYSPNIFFPYRIDYDYDPNPKQEDIDYLNKILFSIFDNDKIVQYVKEKIARGVAGIGYMDKSMVSYIGDPNSGKGVVTEMIVNTMGDYVKTVNSNMFCNKNVESEDDSLPYKSFLTNRYKRMLLTNELKPKSSLNGSLIQTLTSAGDSIDGRALYGETQTFTPCFTIFMYANDRPRIVPMNDPKGTRYIYVNMPFVFTNDVIAENDRLADPDLKPRLKNLCYKTAFFKIIADSYTKKSPTLPVTVVESTNEWNKVDNLNDTLFEMYEITKNTEDVVTNEELNQFFNSKGFAISAVKLGLTLKKIKGIVNDRLKNGNRVWKCLRKKNTNLIINDDSYLSNNYSNVKVI